MKTPEFRLSDVVPWGRSYAEYLQMFGYAEKDLINKQILGCGDGPASFNAEATTKGLSVLSADPLYQFSASQIARRIEETRATIMSQVRKNETNYIWSTIASPEDLERIRLQAMQQFLEDYGEASSKGRYIPASLPALPFAEDQFDICLVSHLLFLYSDHFSADFHLTSILELLRVAREVRIFPLVNLNGDPSPHLQPVTAELTRRRIQVIIEPVSYAFQKGATSMLIVQK